MGRFDMQYLQSEVSLLTLHRWRVLQDSRMFCDWISSQRKSVK